MLLAHNISAILSLTCKPLSQRHPLEWICPAGGQRRLLRQFLDLIRQFRRCPHALISVLTLDRLVALRHQLLKLLQLAFPARLGSHLLFPMSASDLLGLLEFPFMLLPQIFL